MQDKNINSLRRFTSSFERRTFLEQELQLNLPSISQSIFSDEDLSGKNIENLIGSVQIPLGVAGPLSISNLKFKISNYYIPLATTEGALVASISRGCKAITESGGVEVEIENVGISRGPVFKTSGITASLNLKKWIQDNFDLLAQKAQETSAHIKLLKIEFAVMGRNVYARFSFDTADAMGMNMVTIATEFLVKVIEDNTKAKCIALAGNFDIDKKPAWLNFISGRGRKVWAQGVIKKDILQTVLKTTPQQIAQLVVDKCAYGSIMSGGLGFNAHFANVLAAIFAATGQDIAHVVEGSLGVTSAEILETGDLYFSIYLPSLVIGTVGGGTNLLTQQESLNILGVGGGGKTDEFAKIIGGAVLAGELSLLASLSQGSLASSHKQYGRKSKVGSVINLTKI